MKKYYEILEVDKNASQEVIEKAYKTLAKKYHPDLQQGSMKQQYAEKMKIINEAYDVLSDREKREQYNEVLINEGSQKHIEYYDNISKEQQERIIRENYFLKQQLNNIANRNIQEDRGPIGNMGMVFARHIHSVKDELFQGVYMKNSQNRITNNHDLKYYLKLIRNFAIIILVLFLIYQIPFVKNFFKDLYNNNIIFNSFVDIFKNTFSTGF